MGKKLAICGPMWIDKSSLLSSLHFYVNLKFFKLKPWKQKYKLDHALLLLKPVQ